jgi:hypothetical protein
MSNPVIDISVTVYEDAGTANGGYSYVFTPDIVTTTESNTTLCYTLDTDSATNYSITGIYTTDSRFQLATPVLSPDNKSISVLNGNTQPQLIYVALQVEHVLTRRRLSLDPQVINIPPSRPS